MRKYPLSSLSSKILQAPGFISAHRISRPSGRSDIEKSIYNSRRNETTKGFKPDTLGEEANEVNM